MPSAPSPLAAVQRLWGRPQALLAAGLVPAPAESPDE
jgi:hypothetical protein